MKKTVNFIGEAEFFNWEGVVPNDLQNFAVDGKLILGWVYATNHPKLGRGNVRTSVVVKQYKNGNFDTLNTKYKKVLDKD
jgi:hypothetical protein